MKVVRIFVLLICFFLFQHVIILAQSCNCTEYIYLNEPIANSVLKFQVNAGISLTEVQGANGSGYWYPGTGASEILSPHGLGSDLNGNLYIGGAQIPNGTGYQRKLNCDGVLTPVSGTTIDAFAQNTFSIGNILYTNMRVSSTTSNFALPSAFNTCTGEFIGGLCLNGASYSGGSSWDNLWGMSYNPTTEKVYITRRYNTVGLTGDPNAVPKVWVLSRAQLEAGISNGTCYDPLITAGSNVVVNPGENVLPNLGEVLGITGDNAGNFYVIVTDFTTAISYLYKYNASGVLLTSVTLGTNQSLAIGIIWSETTNRLYTSHFTDDPGVNCISTYDANTLTYLGTAAANPGVPSDNTGKAIAIIKECCPINLPTSFQREVCGAIGTKFYLNQEAFNLCDGIVCGSSWTPVGTLNNMIFDACDNSVTVTGSGCGTFTLNIGAVVSTGCGAQSSTFTICNTVPSAAITLSQGTCSASTPNNDAVINITAAINANQAGISTGATYTGPAFNGVGTVAITGGTASFTGRMHNTQYTVRIFNGSNDCFVDYVVTTPTVACCALAVMCSPQHQTNCTPINGSASVSVSGATGTVTYLWSSGEMTSSITNKAAGTYTVTVADVGVAGCTRTCQAVILNQSNAPTCSITVNTQPNCGNLSGGDITVVPSPAGTYTYAWSDNGAATATRTGLMGGTYTVTVTNTTSNCTGVCNVTLTTPTNCCNISAIAPQNLECLDNGTPNKISDNRIRFTANVTNTNTLLTTYNVTINGGTTITPNTNVPYGVTQFTLGAGTAGGGATFTITVTDSATPGCTQTFQVTDPDNCTPVVPPCPTVKCGTATIQVNGN